MKIYLASSWRNSYQPWILNVLRKNGHEVYDFRNPAPENKGFAWSQIDEDWELWDTEQFRNALQHPVAVNGFQLDMNALMECDVCVLLLPCGRSAHTEAGWAAGAGKPVVALAMNREEPELMYRIFEKVCSTPDELIEALQDLLEEIEGNNNIFRACENMFPSLDLERQIAQI